MELVTAAVVEAVGLGPRFRRLVLHVPELDAVELPTAPDTSIGIYFDGPDAPQGRTYTVRDGDLTSRLITVDILLHGDGPGTRWALRTAPGDIVTIGHPGSWYSPRLSSESQLLVADLAGLPALARVLESLPPNAAALAVVEVVDQGDLDYFPQRSEIEIVSSVGTGNGVAESVLTGYVRAAYDRYPWQYCWFAGEAGTARAVRKFLRRELLWGFDQFDVMGYWRLDSVAWDKRYAAVGPRLFAAYQQAVADGIDERLAAEEFDLALEQSGL
jgi:NADPH-dependent ferric siderophore reductase